jgi:hypothetical protein
VSDCQHVAPGLKTETMQQPEGERDEPRRPRGDSNSAFACVNEFESDEGD